MNDIDWPMIVNLGWGAMLAAVGWFVRQLWDAVAIMKRDLHNLEVHLPSNYARKDEVGELLKDMREQHRADMKEIKESLEKIVAKMEEKRG